MDGASSSLAHEEDLKRQYGFTKGTSTETAIHKIERAILNSGMALGIFRKSS